MMVFSQFQYSCYYHDCKRIYYMEMMVVEGHSTISSIHIFSDRLK